MEIFTENRKIVIPRSRMSRLWMANGGYQCKNRGIFSELLLSSCWNPGILGQDSSAFVVFFCGRTMTVLEC